MVYYTNPGVPFTAYTNMQSLRPFFLSSLPQGFREELPWIQRSGGEGTHSTRGTCGMGRQGWGAEMGAAFIISLYKLFCELTD